MAARGRAEVKARRRHAGCLLFELATEGVSGLPRRAVAVFARQAGQSELPIHRYARNCNSQYGVTSITAKSEPCCGPVGTTGAGRRPTQWAESHAA
jgi:hypothetical protein